MSNLEALNQWVVEIASLTQPERIHWCDGSDTEYTELLSQMQADGTLLPLNATRIPTAGCIAPIRMTSRASST